MVKLDNSTNLRQKIERNGVDSLTVNDLDFTDLDRISWSGGAAHIESVRKALERTPEEVDYLAVRMPDGTPIAIGGVDYTSHTNTGTMWQLVTMESLRGLGIGTRLIKELEKKIAARGLHTATIGVEEDNPGARALYERLGYVHYGHEQSSWTQIDIQGERYTHHAEIDLLKKDLE